jgi:hypothetical protein
MSRENEEWMFVGVIMNKGMPEEWRMNVTSEISASVSITTRIVQELSFAEI